MKNIYYLIKISKKIYFLTLITIFSACPTFSSNKAESHDNEEISLSACTSIVSQSDEELVDNPLPFSISKEERRRIWTEEAPRWAESWGITVEEYLERADKFVNHLRKKKKNISGRESLIRHKGQNIEVYNEAFSEQYGKEFTIDDFHMFTLRE